MISDTLGAYDHNTICLCSILDEHAAVQLDILIQGLRAGLTTVPMVSWHGALVAGAPVEGTLILNVPSSRNGDYSIRHMAFSLNVCMDILEINYAGSCSHTNVAKMKLQIK